MCSLSLDHRYSPLHLPQSLPPAYILSHKESFKLRHFFFDSGTSASGRQENCLVRDHLWRLVCTTFSLLSVIWFPRCLVSPAILCFYSCRQYFTCQPHSSSCSETKRPHCLHSTPKRDCTRSCTPSCHSPSPPFVSPAGVSFSRCMHASYVIQPSSTMTPPTLHHASHPFCAS